MKKLGTEVVKLTKMSISRYDGTDDATGCGRTVKPSRFEDDEETW